MQEKESRAQAEGGKEAGRFEENGVTVVMQIICCIWNSLRFLLIKFWAVLMKSFFCAQRYALLKRRRETDAAIRILEKEGVEIEHVVLLLKEKLAGDKCKRNSSKRGLFRNDRRRTDIVKRKNGKKYKRIDKSVRTVLQKFDG